jgi:hypothetical protein
MKSPEVQEAIRIFEEKTGIKVIRGRRQPGSMKEFVNLTIQYPYSRLFRERYVDKMGDLLNGLNVTFIRSDYKNEMLSNIDITWTSLGMSANNAYMPKFR